MAANATDIIPLNTAKVQLGIPTTDTTQDTFITGIIQSAVTAVENDTGVVLVDGNKTERFYPNTPHQPVSLLTDGVELGGDTTNTEADIAVYYYNEEQNEQSYMCKAVRGKSPTPFRQEVKLLPPEGAWSWGAIGTPAGNLHWVNLIVKGPDADDIPAPLKTAALLILDLLYQGSALDTIPSQNAVRILLQPYKRIPL